MPKPIDFDAYSTRVFNEHRTRARLALRDKTPYMELELLVLRMIWLHDPEHGGAGSDAPVRYPDGPAGEVCKHMALKFVQETLAILGSLDVGSHFGANHHARSLIELTLVAFYLFHDASEMDRRLERYTCFPEVFRYNYRKRLEAERDNGEITEDEFNWRCPVSPQDTDVPAARVAHWASIYEAKNGDVSKVRIWWQPETFTRLLEKMAKQGVADFRTAYRNFSNATHLTPHSVGLSRGLRFVALDHHTIFLACAIPTQTLRIICPLLPNGVGDAIWNAANEEIRILTQRCDEFAS